MSRSSAIDRPCKLSNAVRHSAVVRLTVFCKYTVAVLLVIAAKTSMSQVQEIVLEKADGVYQDTVLFTGQSYSFQVRVRNLGVACTYNMGNGFRIYSPDGANWQSTSGQWLNSFDTNFTAKFTNPFSVTGSAADTIAFGGVSFVASKGLPINFDGIVWQLTIGPIPDSSHECTICIDSSFFPPGGAWIWSPLTAGFLTVHPYWAGPKCFRIVGNDDDGDSIGYFQDNCIWTYNPLQEDSDGDEVGDACDRCPGFDDSLDDDSDGVPDLCDVCPGFDDLADADGDGLADSCDNCPSFYNPTQNDYDFDGIGSLCDKCPFDSLNDYDQDGICEMTDNCPYVYNPEQIDSDGDGWGDACLCVGRTGNIDCDRLETVDIGDLTLLVTYLFRGGSLPGCIGEANTDGDPDGVVDIGDLTSMIRYLFIPPFAPLAECE